MEVLAQDLGSGTRARSWSLDPGLDLGPGLDLAPVVTYILFWLFVIFLDFLKIFSGFSMDFLWVSFGFPMGSPWISNVFPVSLRWVSYGSPDWFSKDFLLISYGFPPGSDGSPMGPRLISDGFLIDLCLILGSSEPRKSRFYCRRVAKIKVFTF